MVKEEQIKAYTDRVEASKLTSSSEVKAICSGLFKYVQLFNGLKEEVSVLWRMPMSEIKVINEFACFILPSAVRFNTSDISWSNLLEQDKILAEEVRSKMTYQEFMNLQIKFRNLFKKTVNDNYTTLDVKRKAVSLGDVINNISVDGKAFNYGAPYVPIPVVKGIRILDADDMHWNIKAEEILDAYIASVQF